MILQRLQHIFSTVIALEFFNYFRKKHFFSLIIFLILCILLSNGKHTKYYVFFDLNIEVLGFMLFLCIPGFFFLKIIIKKISNNLAFLLAIPTTISLFSIFFILLQIFKGTPTVHQITYAILPAVILFVSYKKKILKEIIHIDVALKIGILLVYIASIMGTSFVLVNISNPRKEVKDWTIPAYRGFHKLPVDNNLQFSTANIFLKYKEPWHWDPPSNWTMGDRPPLMAVVYSVYSRIQNNNNFWRYQIVGTVLNSLFFLPVFLFICIVFKENKTPIYLSTAILLNCFIFLNIYYTWPKLFSVFFSMISIIVLMNDEEKYYTVPIHSALWGLAVLCHGGALLSIPAFFSFYFLKRFFQIKILIFPYALLFLIVFFLIQLPWTIYKKQHPEINTYRLLINHLSKDYYPENFTPKETKHAFWTFFKQTPIETQIKQRTHNIKDLLIQKQYFFPLIRTITHGEDWDLYFKGLYANEFFNPITAIGELSILMSLFILIYYLLSYLRSKNNKPPFCLKSIIFFTGIVLFSYLFNVFIKWEVSINHELPYLELIIAIIITSGIVISANRIIKLFFLTFIVFRFSYYIIYASLKHGYAIFDFFNIIIFLSVVILFSLVIHFQKLKNYKPFFSQTI